MHMYIYIYIYSYTNMHIFSCRYITSSFITNIINELNYEDDRFSSPRVSIICAIFKNCKNRKTRFFVVNGILECTNMRYERCMEASFISYKTGLDTNLVGSRGLLGICGDIHSNINNDNNSNNNKNHNNHNNINNNDKNNDKWSIVLDDIYAYKAILQGTYIYVYIHICMNTYIYIYLYVYIYIYIYTFIDIYM
jgi:hypothetical protein